MTAPVIYRIDETDRLVAVNEAWSDFARQNDGERVEESRVLGRVLWEFVSDATVFEIYRRMVADVRKGRTLRFNYRCDSATRRREFEMVLAPCGKAGVEFSSTLCSETARPAISLFEPAPGDTSLFVRMCSWCHAVAMPGGSWRKLEEGVREFKLLHGDRKARLTHGICDDCVTLVFGEILAPKTV